MVIGIASVEETLGLAVAAALALLAEASRSVFGGMPERVWFTTLDVPSDLTTMWVPEILARKFRKFWHVLSSTAIPLPD